MWVIKWPFQFLYKVLLLITASFMAIGLLVGGTVYHFFASAKALQERALSNALAKLKERQE